RPSGHRAVSVLGPATLIPVARWVDGSARRIRLTMGDQLALPAAPASLSRMRASLGRALLVGSVVFSPLAAQQPADTGALLLRAGSDTIVVDRFIRSATVIKGRVQVKGQARIDYLARLGPNDRVENLLLAVFAPGAASDAQPTQRIRLTMQRDTAVVETAAGVHRVPTEADAIPMFNNALGLTELFTRRARATGGIADLRYFAINGGTTLSVAVRPVGTDTLTVQIDKQVERLRVDPVGRITGGIIAGTPIDFIRQGAEAA